MNIYYKLVIALILVGSVWGLHVYDKHKAVEQAKAVQLAEFNKQVLDSVLLSIDVEQKIKDDTKKLIDEKTKQLTDITRERNRLVRMLQHRPSRNESPVFTDTGSTCTGRELSREDGEFLAREAARAEKLIRERNFYYEQYEQSRKKIDEFNKSQ
jgi:hypothetical protein